MLAYHNDPVLKHNVLEKMRWHQRQDNFLQNFSYWRNGKGCAVGCLIECSDHSLYEKRFGIPEDLAWLEDTIFENISTEESKKWPVAFLDAIPVGKDLSLVTVKFLLWLQKKNLKFCQDQKFDPKIIETKVIESIEEAVNLLKRLSKNKTVSLDEGKNCARKALEAAWSTESLEGSVNWLECRTAEYSAYSAAYAVQNSGIFPEWRNLSHCGSSLVNAAYNKIVTIEEAAAKLIDLLQEA